MTLSSKPPPCHHLGEVWGGTRCGRYGEGRCGEIQSVGGIKVEGLQGDVKRDFWGIGSKQTMVDTIILGNGIPPHTSHLSTSSHIYLTAHLSNSSHLTLPPPHTSHISTLLISPLPPHTSQHSTSSLSSPDPVVTFPLQYSSDITEVSFLSATIP